MVSVADDFFHNLLGTGVDRAFGLDLGALGGSGFGPLGLKESFSETKVWRVVRELLPDKCPGPDGAFLLFLLGHHQGGYSRLLPGFFVPGFSRSGRGQSGLDMSPSQETRSGGDT